VEAGALGASTMIRRIVLWTSITWRGASAVDGWAVAGRGACVRIAHGATNETAPPT
jgi:hypothetical protein